MRKQLLLLFFVTAPVWAQSRIYGDRTQQPGTTVDATQATHTKPFSTQLTLPATCTANDWLYTPGVGTNMGTLSVCVAPNTWKTYSNGTNGTGSNATLLNGTSITNYSGILKLSNGVLGPLSYSDLTSLWSGSGTYLRADGTLGTPSGTGLTAPGSNGILKYIGSNATAVITGLDIVSLFGSGTCSGFLKSDLTCGTVTGGGTVTQVSQPTVPSWLTASITNPTTTPAITLAASAIAPNLVLAGPPSGSNAPIAARTLVATDIPALDGSKITSGTISSARLPLPGTVTLGVVNSQNCNGGQHINAITTTGSVTCSNDTGGAATVASSAITSMPANSTQGTLYYATDATSNGSTTSSSLWIANTNGAPNPILSLGPSGGLKWYGADTIDVDPTKVLVDGLNQSFAGNKTFSGTVTFTGTVTGVTGSGSTTVTGPYLTINGTNYLPMANMVVPSVMSTSGWSDTTYMTELPGTFSADTSQTAPIITSTANAEGLYTHPIPSGKHTFKVALAASYGIGIVFSQGSQGIACVLWGGESSTNGAQGNQAGCWYLSGAGVHQQFTPEFVDVPLGNAWIGFDLTNPNSAKFIVSFDGGRTWRSPWALDTSSTGMNLTAPNRWGFYTIGSGDSFQVLSLTEQ